jgi:hypothetical protein
MSWKATSNFLANDLEITMHFWFVPNSHDLSVLDNAGNLAPALGEVDAVKKFFVSATGDLAF